MNHLNIPTISSAVTTSSVYVAGNVIGNAVGIIGGPPALDTRQFQFVKGQSMGRRLVRVIIADPNDNLPLDESILFDGGEKFTDATDQELFFEVDIRDLLERHNLKRTKVIDKAVKDRTQHLEPAKVRDLKMVVVNVALF